MPELRQPSPGRARRAVQYTAEQRARVVELALNDPEALDLPFRSWILTRLQDYANEVLEIPMTSAYIGRLLRDAGLRWHQDNSALGQQVNPAFNDLRGVGWSEADLAALPARDDE
jgi:hypothetical protein